MVNETFIHLFEKSGKSISKHIDIMVHHIILHIKSDFKMKNVH